MCLMSFTCLQSWQCNFFPLFSFGKSSPILSPYPTLPHEKGVRNACRTVCKIFLLILLFYVYYILVQWNSDNGKIIYPTNKGAMHYGSSVGTYTVHTDFARLAPKRVLSWHLLTIIINIVLRYIHLHVHFGIKLYTQLALIDKIGTPFFIKGPLFVG